MRPLLRSPSVSPSPLPHGESGAAGGEQAISVDSDMVVILASLLCALVSVVGLALLARCSCRRPRQGGGTRGNSSTSSSAPPGKGLKKAAIEALPTVSFAQRGGGSSLSPECAICLAELAEGEELRVLPHCAHAFHVACIDAWLGSHASCPWCRATVIVPAAGRCQRCGAACDEQVDLGGASEP